jgi:hypothetical protein
MKQRCSESSGSASVDNNHFLNGRGLGQSDIDVLFELDDFAAPVTAISGNDGDGLGVVDAVGEGFG